MEKTGWRKTIPFSVFGIPGGIPSDYHPLNRVCLSGNLSDCHLHKGYMRVVR